MANKFNENIQPELPESTASGIAVKIARCQAGLDAFFQDSSISELFLESCKKKCFGTHQESRFAEVTLNAKMEHCVKSDLRLAMNYPQYMNLRSRVERIWSQLNKEGTRKMARDYFESQKNHVRGSNKKKCQIFISSTYEDLKEERELVQDAILSMNHFPVGMEYFGAASRKWEMIQELLDSTDYFVLLVGQRYGSLTADENGKEMSFTQREYEYAVNHGIPVLAFLLDEKAPVNPQYIETDVKIRKMRTQFIQDVKDRFMVDWWTNAEDLAAKIAISLGKEIISTERPGWVRQD